MPSDSRIKKINSTLKSKFERAKGQRPRFAYEIASPSLLVNFYYADQAFIFNDFYRCGHAVVCFIIRLHIDPTAKAVSAKLEHPGLSTKQILVRRLHDCFQLRVAVTQFISIEDNYIAVGKFMPAGQRSNFNLYFFGYLNTTGSNRGLKTNTETGVLTTTLPMLGFTRINRATQAVFIALA